MSARVNLPARRPRTSMEFQHEGHMFVGGAGYYENGRIGEVFLSSGKPNSQMDIVAQDAAIAASYALQHGAGLNEMRQAFLRAEDGSAAGPLGRLFDLLWEDRRGALARDYDRHISTELKLSIWGRFWRWVSA